MLVFCSVATQIPNVNRTIRTPAKDAISDLAPPPQWIEPELCKLVRRIPAGDDWAHEIKFDGFRMPRHGIVLRGILAFLARPLRSLDCGYRTSRARNQR